MDKLYWGIVSAGKISHDFVNAVNDPSGPALAHNKVLAVAATQLDRAKTFAENHGIETVYGSYEELAQNKDINIVYVGNTIVHHARVCKMMLEAGKHVLCEKTMTPSSKDSRELYELAKSKSLFLMEGVWSNFFPSYKEIKRQITEGVIGEVVHAEVSFGLDIRLIPRKYEKDLGGGAALDLGIYCVNLIRLAFSREEPKEILVRGNLYPSGCDADWDAVLLFSNNRRGIIKCSSTYGLSNSARITGTKGCIEIPGPLFYSAEEIVDQTNTSFKVPLPNQARFEYNYPNSAGLAYEAAAVSEIIRAGKLECEEYTPADSLYIASILDKIQELVGVKYD